MPDETPPNANEPRDLLRAALAHAVRCAGREVTVAASGIVIGDGLGRRSSPTRDGRPVSLDPAAAAAYLDGNVSWRTRLAAERETEVEDLGTWRVRKGEDGTLTLRPKKPAQACMEALFEAPDEDLVALRGLYRSPGVTVLVMAEGETRAREIAVAITAERRLLGLPTGLAFPLTHQQRNDISWGRGILRAHDGSDAFDLPPSDLPRWSVEVLPESDAYHPLPEDAPDPGVPSPPDASRVIVRTGRDVRYGRYADATDAALASRTDPVALLVVRIDGEGPVGNVVMSPSARAIAEASAPFENSSWDAFVAKRAARLKARPPKPKTWHTNSLSVATAFAAQEAPRGLMSGETLFFAGPVAFSLYDSNPVAAIVETADGIPTMLMGTSGRFGSSKAGVVSSAAGDIRAAAHAGYRIVDVDDIDPIVTIGGRRLRDVAPTSGRRGWRRDVPEGLPRLATVDVAALESWIRAEAADRHAGVAKAYETRFPTFVQSGALYGLYRIAERRDTLALAFARDLPVVGDAADLKARSREASKAAQARQDDLDARTRLREAAARAIAAAEAAAAEAARIAVAAARAARAAALAAGHAVEPLDEDDPDFIDEDEEFDDEGPGWD